MSFDDPPADRQAQSGTRDLPAVDVGDAIELVEELGERIGWEAKAMVLD